LNQPFRKHARTGRPLVTLKLAISLDGRASTAPGDSPWISGEQSRALVHRWRGESDAIAVGIGTVLADDPLLTARGPGAARQPLRVVFDRSARLPLDSRLLRTLDQAPVLAVVSSSADTQRVSALHGAGAEVLVADAIEPALEALGGRGIASLFLEGGPTLSGSFAAVGEVDEARTFVAPVLLGGGGSRVGAEPVAAARLTPLTSTVEAVGDDALITARFREW
jgi:diaminohydroxyphosphoribosylaminopyrimidine deaminase/5-amino-6-(5-phosphoribosylamino)uracil reductase